MLRSSDRSYFKLYKENFMNEKSKTELLRFWNGYFKKLSKIDSMIVGKKSLSKDVTIL